MADFSFSSEQTFSLLNTYSFTASFRSQPLEQKLEIICKSVGADYKPESGKYIMTGEGCRILK
jgi:transmembrane sensor